MKLDRTARTILSITALAWAIPFAQAQSNAQAAQVGVIQPQAKSAEFDRLDADGDGLLSYQEVGHLDGYQEAFAQADRNRDARLDASEAITAHQLYERSLATRYAQDTWLTTKVKVALLREEGLDSGDVSVETFDQRVLLSGFVEDAEQKRKALLIASRIEGVKDVKDALALRK
ncbi:MAG: BON domain-containing protein [Betaproteobacteria bacterium]|nr:BON domain-containing protein [Betaproteobacteria bacterium]MDH5220028.1 BON domain-containing protein [Betaproteobacteria bacterium]MDH5349390.1 BON domain-containing protein [Betaproteobacteria bacterium]